jgi:SAM-dependent methyltransferase
MKERSLKPEIMDQPHASAEVTRKFHRDLALVHRLMGNWDQILDRLKTDPELRSVVDIGCGDGEMLKRVRDRLKIGNVIGVDIKPPDCVIPGITVTTADATRDLLPLADTAVCVMMLHHLTDHQVAALIRNVGRSAKRFICLDLVRHPLPLVFFTVFICPLLSRVSAVDGRQSIRRSFTGEELHTVVDHAIAGSGATFEHWISPIYARQMIDIRWPNRPVPNRSASSPRPAS